MVVDQSVQGKFKGAGLNLLFKIDNNHGVLIVVVFFEVGHGNGPLADAEFYQKMPCFRSFSTASTPSLVAVCKLTVLRE